jgi:opacity protein-like surface antigen
MTRPAGWMAGIAAALPIAGCGVLPDAYSGCDEPQPYESAQQIDSLRVPSGADMPDTRNALKIPQVQSPELPSVPGGCLDHPPAYAAGSKTGASAASPTATGAITPAATTDTLDLDLNDGSPWQTRLGVNYQLTSNTDFDGGTTAEFDSSTGFVVGFGYDFSNHLEIGANFSFNERDFDARVAGDAPGEVFPVNGSLEAMGVTFDLTYYFMTGRFTPFITSGIGWNWVDTNIPTAPPQVGCWWDPWYGYICEGFQETKSVDGFTYQLGAGLRYRLSKTFSLNGGYRMSWLDFPKASGTPTFDGIQLILDWGF